MDPIRRFAKPTLRRPRALIAFEGWNDASDAASGVAAYLLGQHDVTEPFATIEPEEFYDFQSSRPVVSVDEGGTRSLTWPKTHLYAIRLPADDRDLVVVLAEEPSYRWKTYSRLITQLLSECDVEEVVLLGAFIGQVPHTRPVPIIGVATDPELVHRYGLLTSAYEGPTGIVGVMQEACREVGLPAMSLWSAVPHYLAANPNPRAMLALLNQAAEILRLKVDASELRTVAEEFNDRVNAAIAASDEFAEYIATLEEHDDETVPVLDPDRSPELVNEIEDFLRDK